MKVAVFLNNLGLGGTEKAACRWAWGLKDRGHEVLVLALRDGPRRAELERHAVPLRLAPAEPPRLAALLRELAPQVIHAHAPGHPHEGDVLGAALALLPKIPVVQTNVFGHLYNPKEEAWTDFRLFISWTSCVQAARRVFRPLDEAFFAHASVAVYPLDPVVPPPASAVAARRSQWGVTGDEILFGRFSRPDPNKWTSLAVDAFRQAVRRNPHLKLLLREPPPAVANALRETLEGKHFIILPATSDATELALSMAAVDVVLHTSSIGESFGYGIAEPMNLGRPVITHSVPWQDQAQLELVRHGECGYIASTPGAMAAAMLQLGADPDLRTRMGAAARQHMAQLANPDESLSRLESALALAVAQRPNPRAAEDLGSARAAAAYLDQHQFGHSAGEQLKLRPFYWRARFHQWRQRRRVV